MIKLDESSLTAAYGSVSVSAGAYGWLANVNEVLQFVSLAISIVLGTYAIIRIYKNREKK